MSTAGLRRICLVGVRGVGKTTLIRSVIDSLPHIDYIVGSAVLRALAGEDFKRFDHLPVAVKERYRHDAIGWMEDRQAMTGKHVLCDGHTSLLDESTGQVGPVFTDRDCHFFRELILLEAPVEVVLAHRQGDMSKRRTLDRAVVSAELRGERLTSEQVAEAWGMALHRLPPSTDLSTARHLVELLKP